MKRELSPVLWLLPAQGPHRGDTQMMCPVPAPMRLLERTPTSILNPLPRWKTVEAEEPQLTGTGDYRETLGP